MSERGETSPEGATLPVGVAAALALARHDPARGEAHLRQVLASRPDDNEIRWILARYLHDVRRDSAAAEVEYLALIARAPERAEIQRSYARLLWYDLGDLTRAEVAYRRAVALAPHSADALTDLGYFLEKGPRALEEAEASYEAALSHEPEHLDTLETYARFLHHVRGDVRRADETYRRALAVDPDSAELWSYFGVFLSTAAQDVPRAREAFERCLELDPNHSFGLTNFALMLHGERDDPERAQRCFERALSVEPERWSTHWWFAAFLDEERHDRERAAKHYRRAIALEPGNAALLRSYQRFIEGEGETQPVGVPPHREPADTLSDHAYDLELQGAFVAAEEAYETALARHPNHGPTLRRYAAMLVHLGRLDEAEPLLRRGVELSPRDGWTRGLLARFLAERRGALKEADLQYREAISNGLHEPKWLAEYARFLELRLGDTVRATAFFERALALNPPVEVVVDFGCFLERTQRDLAGAAAAFRAAMDMSPADVFPRRQYARFLEESREDDDAAEAAYEQALQLSPTDPLTLGWFARFQERRRGDIARAAELIVHSARANPEDVGRWAEAARFLLRHGLVDEAVGALRSWIAQADGEPPEPTWAEALFCGLVYLPPPERERCFERLKALMAMETPTDPWDPTPHLRALAEQTRDDHRWVARLATVLVTRVPPSTT